MKHRRISGLSEVEIRKEADSLRSRRKQADREDAGFFIEELVRSVHYNAVRYTEADALAEEASKEALKILDENS